MATTKTIGDHGEGLAVRFLKEKGYMVVDRNYRHSRSEIDIIAEKDGIMVFIEVKTRSRTDYGEPEEGLTQSQETRILEAAEVFLESYGWEKDIRFDIVAITLGHPPQIRHFEDAFY